MNTNKLDDFTLPIDRVNAAGGCMRFWNGHKLQLKQPVALGCLMWVMSLLYIMRVRKRCTAKVASKPKHAAQKFWQYEDCFGEPLPWKVEMEKKKKNTRRRSATAQLIEFQEIELHYFRGPGRLDMQNAVSRVWRLHTFVQLARQET